jgi:hypothetical protein
MGEVLKEHFGVTEDDSPEAIADRLADRPYLGLTLGLAPSRSFTRWWPAASHDAWSSSLPTWSRSTGGDAHRDVHWAEDDRAI